MSHPRRRTRARTSEYISVFLQLRSPLQSALPLFEKWRDLIDPLVGNVRVFGEEIGDGNWRKYRRTPLRDLAISGHGSLGLTSVDAVPAPKKLEVLVQLAYDKDTVCCCYSFGPTVRVVLGLSHMDGAARALLDSSLAAWFPECAHLVDARYGLIDLADCWETGVGRWLGSTDQAYASFQRRFARAIWAREAGSDSKVIGVFWANLLGPEILARLGGFGRLRDELPALPGVPRDKTCFECPNGAAVVQVSANVTDFAYPGIESESAEHARAEWLYRRFAQSGLLPDPPTPDGFSDEVLARI